MQNTHNARKGRSIFTGDKERDAPGAHWITVGGNHVLIREGEEQAQQQQPAIPQSQRSCRANQSAWEKDAEQARVSNDLVNVHDLGLIVFNKTQSYSDRPDSNEPIDTAREKLAHSVLNADEKWGSKRMRYASTALAIEPSDNALKNPAVRSAYESSMKAAREAYLSCDDPTHGAVHAIQVDNPSRSNYVFRGGKAEGVPISTQSGPYNNSYIGGQMPSRIAWLNTYLEK